jgi:hypothetical protein
MRKLAKWIVIVLGGIVSLLLLVSVTVLVLGQKTLNRRYDIARTAPDVRSDSAAIARGGHLARVLGCYTCHGDRLEGIVFIDQPMLGRLIAPNVTRVRDLYDDADFERLHRRPRSIIRNLLSAAIHGNRRQPSASTWLARSVRNVTGRIWADGRIS